MTFDSRERSVASGQPIRLYLFARGALRWAYCSADRDVAFQAVTYKAMPISDDGVRITGEASADVLKVTAPATLEVAQLFRGAPPSSEIELTVRDYHYGEADSSTSSQVVWVGSVSGVRWPQPDRAEIACESIGASMDRTGLRLTWERNCPFTVFDADCKADRASRAVSTTLTAITATTITAAAFSAKPDGYFAGGYVEWGVGAGELERRGVESHVGSVLTILGGTSGMAAGLAIAALPGCRQTAEYCNSEFNNLDNFGGIRHLPGKSPFDGQPMF